MKIYLISLAFFISFQSHSQEDPTISDITTTLNYYLGGGTNNDFETLKKAFHESATMIYMKDEYQEVNAIDFFEKIMKPGPTQNRKTSILSIDYSGSYASAKLKIDYPKHSYIDYMHLIKIDDEWKVVNQIFDRVTLSD